MTDALTTKWTKQIGENAPWIMIGLALLVVLMGLLAVSGYRKASNAQSRLTTLEVEQQTSNISRVATCFPSARNRNVVIGGLSGLVTQMDVTINATITNIQVNPTREQKLALQRLLPAREKLQKTILIFADNSPTLDQCEALAKNLGVDPRPFRKPQGKKQA